MDRSEIQKQYDRFLSQVREEAKDLYWLYNFFFVIESAMLGALFVGKLSPQYIDIAQVTAIALSIYWLIIIRKQRLWRNNWVKRIQILEKELQYESPFQMWPEKTKDVRVLKDYLLGKRGLWRFLFFLPIGFAVVWILIAIG